jgi:hypothetical protein
MRVVSESKWELIAAHRPRWLPLAFLVAGVLFTLWLQPVKSLGQMMGAGAPALFFVFSAYMLSTRYEFRFDATARKVTWHEKRPFAADVSGVIAFRELKSVAVQTQDDDGKSYRVVLSTTAGDTPLTRHYSTVEPHEETTRRIADWLRAHGVGISTE